MKTSFLYKVLLIAFLSLITVSCSSDDDGVSNSIDSQIVAILEYIDEGTWRVTNFNDSGENETSDFNGYTFTFQNIGIFDAVSATTIESGTWALSSSGSDSTSEIDMNITFNSPINQNFLDLTDKWDVVSVSNTVISLRDVSGGDGSIDLLEFTKN